jgi:hypothetical protein
MWRNLTFAAALAFAAPVVPAVAAPDQEPQAPSVGATPSAQADATRADAPTTDRSSPWLLVPLVASSPKLGTSVGRSERSFMPSIRPAVCRCSA